MPGTSSTSVTRVGKAALSSAALLAATLGLAACSTGPGASQTTASASASRNAEAADPQQLQGVSINVLNGGTTDLWWREPASAGTSTTEWQPFQRGETVNHDTVLTAGNAQNQIEIGVGNTAAIAVINLLGSDLPSSGATGGVPLQICDTELYGTQPRQSLPRQSCKGRNYDVKYTVTKNAAGGQVASWSIRITTA